MPSELGFAMLTHSQPDHVARLVTVLNRVFGDPPITIHHDARRCSLPTGLPRNVHVFESGLKTNWGSFELVEASIMATERLMDRQDAPKWCYLLTGNCYPIKNRSQVLSHLESLDADAALNQSVVYPKPDATAWDADMKRRYVDPYLRFWRPTKNRGLLYKYLSLPWETKRSPFSEELPCRVGPAFYTVNEKAARVLSEGLRDRELVRWYRKRFIPDESFFQTVLGNAPDLRISNSHLHFIEWVDPILEPSEANPRTLTDQHLDKLVESPKHFARKVIPGHSDALMSRLDQEVLAAAS